MKMSKGLRIYLQASLFYLSLVLFLPPGHNYQYWDPKNYVYLKTPMIDTVRQDLGWVLRFSKGLGFRHRGYWGEGD